MDTGFGVKQLYSACRLTMTHHYPDIEHECKPLTGTGFLVEFPTPDNRIGLVTNRHLTDAPFHKPSYKGTTIKSIKVQWWQSKQLRLEHIITDPKPLYHSDPLIDVAVVPIVGTKDSPISIEGSLYADVEEFVANADTDTLMFNHAHDWDYLMQCEKLWPQLEPGEFVTFPGYPTWYDRLQIRPVLRSGVIASDPQTDYRYGKGEPTNTDSHHQVLFDAFSTNGNSGSPVYVAQRGLPPIDMQFPAIAGRPGYRGQLTYNNYRRSFLIGINASHYNDTDSPRPNDHAGLSRMHKLSVILDILRENEAPFDPDARRIRIAIPAPPDLKIKPKAKPDAAVRDQSIMALHRDGKSNRTIAAEVGCSASTVGRVIKKALSERTLTCAFGQD
ncbi:MULTISPECIES: helix-turn-helix domain-containing protein [unclassified Mycobacterium]|uniref:helix-turn-helix domain-containing protein n=1 Tax=unclassified Mycobacterium TaxID=2642494 RepID=UPI0008947983|nr:MULTISPECIES: helix-turn-helix domain-containing protein [unclassified Mycobacterium]SEA87426.1 Homeodomain-like domain-containing protein [Mycobacterium sp. 283mftsu]